MESTVPVSGDSGIASSVTVTFCPSLMLTTSNSVRSVVTTCQLEKSATVADACPIATDSPSLTSRLATVPPIGVRSSASASADSAAERLRCAAISSPERRFSWSACAWAKRTSADFKLASLSIHSRAWL